MRIAVGRPGLLVCALALVVSAAPLGAQSAASDSTPIAVGTRVRVHLGLFHRVTGPMVSMDDSSIVVERPRLFRGTFGQRIALRSIHALDVSAGHYVTTGDLARHGFVGVLCGTLIWAVADLVAIGSSAGGRGASLGSYLTFATLGAAAGAIATWRSPPEHWRRVAPLPDGRWWPVSGAQR
ncbi:MAG TPA: hypothetical protein VFK13_00615 [Gemmatimonadaceae bacterium]|nr:hypothetical protein [Gemmatimonadaceae bacterium]